MFIKSPQPESSFLSVEKDMNLIVSKMLKNERLKRLLFYTTKDALDKKNLTEDQDFVRIVAKGKDGLLKSPKQTVGWETWVRLYLKD